MVGIPGNCSDLRGSADYSAYCGGATEHGISTANRFRPLKREQLPFQQVVAGCRTVWMFDVLIASRSAGGDDHDSRSRWE